MCKLSPSTTTIFRQKQLQLQLQASVQFSCPLQTPVFGWAVSYSCNCPKYNGCAIKSVTEMAISEIPALLVQQSIFCLYLSNISDAGRVGGVQCPLIFCCSQQLQDVMKTGKRSHIKTLKLNNLSHVADEYKAAKVWSVQIAKAIAVMFNGHIWHSWAQIIV